MAGQPDRLSELPYELLQHMLHLAPCREAVSTAVLSRRWRGLWPPPTAGAVKIDIPSGDILPFHDALLRAPSHGPVVRLAINVGVPCDSYIDAVGDVLSHPASRGVQDVHIHADDTSRGLRLAFDDVGDFRFSFASVPSAALRMLHLTNCGDLTPPPSSSTFPCLEVLRLRQCKAGLQNLQDIVVPSPRLAALQLERVHLLTSASSARLCRTGVTTLVLLNCSTERWMQVTIELDVPSVQHFRYKGNMCQFTLRSPLQDARRVYLHIIACHHCDVETCASFWYFLKNISDTKVLKLKLDWPIDYVAALARCRIWDLLIGEHQSAQSIRFCVEHLEIDAPYNPESKDVGLAIGNLLQCCPALHDLRLKLNTTTRNRSTSLQSKAQKEFDKSIAHFRRRRERPRPLVPSCGDDGLSDILDILGLSDRWFHFSCLHFHLKRLTCSFIWIRITITASASD